MIKIREKILEPLPENPKFVFEEKYAVMGKTRKRQAHDRFRSPEQNGCTAASSAPVVGKRAARRQAERSRRGFVFSDRAGAGCCNITVPAPGNKPIVTVSAGKREENE